MELLKESANLSQEQEIVIEEKISANLVLAKTEEEIENNIDELVELTRNSENNRAVHNVKECFKIAGNYSKKDNLRNIIALKTTEELLPLVEGESHTQLKELAYLLEEIVEENDISSEFGSICAQAFIKTVRIKNKI